MKGLFFPLLIGISAAMFCSGCMAKQLSVKAMNKTYGIALALTRVFAATPINAVLKPCKLVTLLSLLFLCSCASPPLPADVSMNREVRRGGGLIVMVRVNGSEPLPFLVDTGCPWTILDQSLESKLGRRLGQGNMDDFGVKFKGDVYWPPRLYLGDKPLLNRGYVAAVDCGQWSKSLGMPLMGILGMDVLKHYCVQLDFQNGQVHFLDPEHADKKDWGQPFHLTGIGDGCVSIDENLTGAKGARSLIDTGCVDWDGNLTAKSFQQWTNQSTPPANGEFRSPNGTLGGEMYHDLDLCDLQEVKGDGHTRLNIIGIHVLSENLVTFDFPERTMYLKRTSDMPLIDKKCDAYKSAENYLQSLADNGQLPGWAKNDVAGKGVDDWTQSNGLDLVTFDLQKKGKSSDYHFTVTRTSRGSPWKLEKAWLTDQGNQTLERFAVP